MIAKSRNALLPLTVAVTLAAFGPTPESHAKTARPVAAAPTVNALLALERKANEAFIKGDGTFFEGLLSDKLVMHAGGVRIDKAEAVKRISGTRCVAKKGWTLTRPQLLKIDDDAYVLDYVSDMQGSCTAGGKTEAMPSPVRAASVWIRNGGRWQVAFHGENPIVDPAAPRATDNKAGPGKDDQTAAKADTAVEPASAKPAADPTTVALMAAENAIWGAWKDKDAKRIAGLTARDIAFVDIYGTYQGNKADTIKDWTGPLCNVTNFTLKDGVGTSVAPTVAILTLTGTINGSCGGKDISGLKVYGNSVYVKDGGNWKWAFGFNSPT